MFNQYFNIRTLKRALDKIKTPPRVCRDTFFKTRTPSPTSAISVDIIEGTEGILPNIAADAPSTPTARTRRSTRLYEAARLAPKKFIPLAELVDARGHGEQFLQEFIKNRIGRELKAAKNEIDRTREYYACQAMTGTVIDKDGSTVLFDYIMPAGHAVTLTSTDKWDDHTNSVPHLDIRTWCGMIADEIGMENVQSFVALAAPDVINDMLANKNFTDLVKTQIGVQVALEGKLEKMGGVNIVEYRGFFKDDAGTKHRLVPDGYFRLGAVTDDLTEEIYAPPVKLVQGGVGSGQGPAEFAIDYEWKKDPAGVWIYVENRPLPAVHDGNVFVNAKVK